MAKKDIPISLDSIIKKERILSFFNLDWYNLVKSGKTLNSIINFEEVPMETSHMKNMVILKNLPSNLVEEAIIILKSSKKVKKLEKIDKKNNSNPAQTLKKEKDYILKEAEMLVSSYISKLEDKQEQKQYGTIKNNKKYIRLKKYAFLSSLIIFIQMMLLILK